jgi:hypothetical protein
MPDYGVSELLIHMLTDSQRLPIITRGILHLLLLTLQSRILLLIKIPHLY